MISLSRETVLDWSYKEIDLDNQSKYVMEVGVFKIGYFAAHARFPAEHEIERFLEALEKENNEKIK